jgi:methionyl aminopeptidase
LREGDIVSIDTGCSLSGWCGDAAATFAVGAVSPEVRRLLEVTKAVLQLAIDLLRTSRRWSQVASEMDTYVRRAKFSTVVKYVGHGIGREMHEDPQVPNYVDRKILRKGDFPLEPGLVLAIEPMVNMGSSQVRRLGDTWTVVTADGKPSAHFEHTVALTSNGPCVLTAGPHGESW